LVDAGAWRNTIVVMPSAHPGSSALHTELAQLGSELVLRTSASALGVVGADSAPIDPAQWPAVTGHYLDWADPEVMTLYALSSGRFIRHQVARTGVVMTVALPMSRVRRIVEERSPQTVMVAIEIDADRSTLEFAGALTGDGQVVVSGAQTASGYLIGATDEVGMARLGNFGAVLRAHLA
jgi:hypothetical protein